MFIVPLVRDGENINIKVVDIVKVIKSQDVLLTQKLKNYFKTKLTNHQNRRADEYKNPR